MSSDLLALAMRHDADARDELAARLTLLNRAASLDRRARHELQALLRELRDQVSAPMRRAIDVSLGDTGRFPGDVVRAKPVASDEELVQRAMKDEADRL